MCESECNTANRKRIADWAKEKQTGTK